MASRNDSCAKASPISSNKAPAITNAEHYARIVEEKALLRRLIVTANDVAELGYSPLDDIEKTIDSAESLIFAALFAMFLVNAARLRRVSS